ncbi:MAG: type III pantothenate kinase [Planctomycetota bacterium]|nr:type III pantothenate kinase [Planctomycetota bacterium]
MSDTAHEDPVIGVAIGNTRARWGLLRGDELDDVGSAPAGRPDEIAAGVLALSDASPELAILVAGVNPPAADALVAAIEDASPPRVVLLVGEDIGIPLRHALDDASTLGQDRALCALAAHSRAGQACVVVDAGTAITVDFVDGEGVFQGGVIAPGLNMMLRAMHEHTAALPLIDFELPDEARGPFGRDTRHAMLLGVRDAARGLVRHVVERYADHYGAYPQVIATGGDAPALFEGDGLVEHIVPDLQLLGVAKVWASRADGEE